jgi:YHS domain-containing protein
MPLPIISTSNLVSGLNNLPELPKPIPLSAEAAKAASEMSGASSGENRDQFKKYPKAFADDMDAGSGTGDYALKAIVQGPFAKRDWQNTKNELIQYLSIPRSAEIEARARFYLGQSYYFTAAPQEALFEFLMAQNAYEKEAAEWIQASLAMLNTK